MPASPAQIQANIGNSARSSGPKTPEGKSRSRLNAFKHGLTGAGVGLPEEDAAEVERLAVAFRDELRPEGQVGEILVRRMATLAVRMDRCFEQETAAISEHVQKVMDEFEVPEGVDAETAEQLRVLAGRRAMFDPSKEACLARRYEAAAERGFFRSLKELRQLRRPSEAAPAVDPAAEARASIARLNKMMPAEKPAQPTPAPTTAPKAVPVPPKTLPTPAASWAPAPSNHFDIPLAIGRAR